MFPEAFEYLDARQVELAPQFYARLDALRPKAWTVAKLHTLAEIEAVKASLSHAMQQESYDFKTWQKTAPAAIRNTSRHYQQLVYRNAMMSSYNGAKWAGFRYNARYHPILRYYATHDSRARPSHKALHGLMMPVDDPRWATIAPQNGHNCFLPQTRVQGEFEIGLKSFYTGEAVEVTTLTGKRLAITANHPILTARGWVRACELKETDYLLSCENGSQPTVESTFAALKTQGFGVADIEAFAFHDDTKLRENRVYVSGRHIHLLHGVTEWQAENNPITMPAPQGMAFNLPREVIFDNGAYHAIKQDAQFSQTAIKNISRFHYRGYVYDFQTKNGVIVAEGIVSHNCRCVLASLTQKQAEARGYKGAPENLPTYKDKNGVEHPFEPDKGWAHTPELDLKNLEEHLRKREQESGLTMEIMPEFPPVPRRPKDVNTPPQKPAPAPKPELPPDVPPPQPKPKPAPKPPEYSPPEPPKPPKPNDPTPAPKPTPTPPKPAPKPTPPPKPPESIIPPKDWKKAAEKGREIMRENADLFKDIDPKKDPYAFPNAVRELMERHGVELGGIAAVKGDHAEVIQQVLGDAYPASWIEASNELGDVYSKASNKRSFHLGIKKDRIVKALKNINTTHPSYKSFESFLKDFIDEIKAGDSFYSIKNLGDNLSNIDFTTIIHEFGHRLQMALPELDEYFKQAWRDRTKGDKPQRLKDIYPNLDYDLSEITLKDKFVDAYFGKIKGGLDDPQPIEMLTMTFQCILGADPDRLKLLIETKDDLLYLAIYLLLRFKP